MAEKRKADGDHHDAKRAHAGHHPAGQLLGVGINCFGQLGWGSEVDERKKPTPITGSLNTDEKKQVGALEGKDVVAAAAGGMHSLALTAEGQVFSMGCNDEGALGRVHVGEEGEFFPAAAQGLDGVVVTAVSAGDSHSLALAKDGRVFMCGTFRDGNGGLGFSPTVEKSVPFKCIYPESGKVTKAFDPAVQIASGAHHAMYLTKKGHVFTLGAAEQGQLGRIKENQSSRMDARVGTNSAKCPFNPKVALSTLERYLVPQQVKARGMKAIKSISCGSWTCFATAEDGTIWGWGLNNYAQLGFRQEKETAVYFPEVCTTWTDLGVQSFGLGQHHVLALTKDGSVFSSGRGDAGRLGHGDTAELFVPKAIEGLRGKNVSEVSCGLDVSFAVTKDGHGYAWGFGENLQLGTGDDADCLVPTLIEGKALQDAKVKQISGGGQHTVIVAHKA